MVISSYGHNRVYLVKCCLTCERAPGAPSRSDPQLHETSQYRTCTCLSLSLYGNRYQ